MKHIESCGRVCYKSEHKITTDSYIKFIQNIIKRGHESVLEHGNIILRCNKATTTWFGAMRTIIAHRLNLEVYIRSTEYAVSANIRAWRDFFKAVKEINPEGLVHFYPLMRKYDILFGDILSEIDPDIKPYKGGIFWIEITMDDLNENERLTHHCETVRFITDRGISHEIVRHRPASFSQESTRYCNYSKDDFCGEITVIKPCFLSEHTQAWWGWYDGCKRAEDAYFNLLDIGLTPQEARSVLPTSLKTEVVMTTNLREWRHFLKLRTASSAHPQIREIAIPLLAELKQRIPVVFDDIH
jgi:thymidylate synthase (FAD)